MPFLPITREEMKERGIEQFDFVYVIGDAYVDHSSFGPAIISRVLEANGYSVGIISQPDWKDENSISIFGEPRLGFLVSSGTIIPWRKSTEKQMPLRRAVSWENGRTARLPCTAI